MDAKTKATIERLTRQTIDKLREALEECKAGRYASASCAATEAKQLAEVLNDEMYAEAQSVYQWPDICPLLPSTPPATPPAATHAKVKHPTPIYFHGGDPMGRTFNPEAPRQDSSVPVLLASHLITPAK